MSQVGSPKDLSITHADMQDTHEEGFFSALVGHTGHQPQTTTSEISFVVPISIFLSFSRVEKRHEATLFVILLLQKSPWHDRMIVGPLNTLPADALILVPSSEARGPHCPTGRRQAQLMEEEEFSDGRRSPT